MSSAINYGMAVSEQSTRQSPFLHTPDETEAGSMAILHLKRDSLVPITLQTTSDDGYVEGPVTNTRFGSFPHSTLVGLEWGSQVRASKVNTGARGQRNKASIKDANTMDDRLDLTATNVTEKVHTHSKRSSDEMQPTENGEASKRLKRASTIEAPVQRNASPQTLGGVGSGFIHILPPTPETWTASLDHRTQVVYTPDSSYILQRLQVRPGSTIIEAGAGSGSFTHAAARAVFNGYPSMERRDKVFGAVYSFEYHAPRVQRLREEIKEHGLDEIVHLTHRDVCNEGFVVSQDDTMPKANAVFLDLPAPWLALKHLTRSNAEDCPLDRFGPIHLCAFSPCIEQVMATATALRKSGWTRIEMVEIQHKRIDVRRERVGLQEEGLRGVNAAPANVNEAVVRLREVETKLSDFHANQSVMMNSLSYESRPVKVVQSKQERLEKVKAAAETRKLYKEGNLVHRSEPEVKTHTSYLTFAILPREWSEEDEKACAEMWPVGESTSVNSSESIRNSANDT